LLVIDLVISFGHYLFTTRSSTNNAYELRPQLYNNLQFFP
jgi:hypothetical protein